MTGTVSGSMRPDVLRQRILIVDDEDGIRIALSRFLTRRGFAVSGAADGTAALALLQGERFALMICDLRMPGLSGLQVTSSALEIDADLAVIMLTGTNEGTTADDVRRIGASDYLMKPLELADLSSAIERALALRESRMNVREAQNPVTQPEGTRQSSVLPAA